MLVMSSNNRILGLAVTLLIPYVVSRVNTNNSLVGILVPILVPFLVSRVTKGNRISSPSKSFYIHTLGFCLLATLLIRHSVYQWKESWDSEISSYGHGVEVSPWLVGRFGKRIAKLLWSIWPTNVLESRSILVHLRKSKPELFSYLQTGEGKLMYGLYGPAVVQCTWCTLGEPLSYALYTGARVAQIYALNAALIIAFSTEYISAAKGWRKAAVSMLFLVAIVDVLRMPFGRTTFLPIETGYPAAFWELLYRRLLSLAVVNTAFVAATCLTAFGVLWDPTVEKIDSAQKMAVSLKELAEAFNKFKALSILTSVVNKSEELSKTRLEYWKKITANMKAVKDQGEVAKAVTQIMQEPETQHSCQKARDFVEKYIN